MRMILPVVKAFMKKKITDRMKGPLGSRDALLAFVANEQLLPIYGGSLEYDHEAWMDEIVGLQAGGYGDEAQMAAATAEGGEEAKEGKAP